MHFYAKLESCSPSPSGLHTHIVCKLCSKAWARPLEEDEGRDRFGCVAPWQVFGLFFALVSEPFGREWVCVPARRQHTHALAIRNGRVDWDVHGVSDCNGVSSASVGAPRSFEHRPGASVNQFSCFCFIFPWEMQQEGIAISVLAGQVARRDFSLHSWPFMPMHRCFHCHWFWSSAALCNHDFVRSTGPSTVHVLTHTHGPKHGWMARMLPEVWGVTFSLGSTRMFA